MFVTTCGTSFYSQCLPPQSINLIFSATAMHWLREKPCDVTGALHHTMITVPEEAERFRIQAAKDWETLLLARARRWLRVNRKIQTLFSPTSSPGLFPLKMGGAAPHPFFKEKPWGRGWVLTSPDIFKNRDFFPPFYFPSIRKRRFRVPKTWVLERSPEWSFCKRRFIVFVWTDVNEGF